MWKTIIRTTACLAVSAAAFIAIAKMDATAAAKRPHPVPEADAPKPDAPKPAPPKAPAPSTPKLTLASLSLPASKAATAPTTGKTDDAGTVTLPDWKGKRLSVAMRAARKLGLTVSAVDETGQAVTADMASEYRVRRQLTKAGTALEPGAGVEVRVREIAEPAMGY
jgi:hypothetical protein